MAKNDKDELFTPKILETPQVRAVVDAAGNTMAEMGDFGASFERFKQVAQANGSWEMIKVSIGLDLLKIVGPRLIQSFQIWMSRQNKK